VIDRLELEDEFVRRLRERWKRGAEAYGDSSFRRPVTATAEEILQEVEDIAGWAFIAWCQLRQRLAVIVSAAPAISSACEVETEHLRAHA